MVWGKGSGGSGARSCFPMSNSQDECKVVWYVGVLPEPWQISMYTSYFSGAWLCGVISSFMALSHGIHVSWLVHAASRFCRNVLKWSSHHGTLYIPFDSFEQLHSFSFPPTYTCLQLHSQSRSMPLRHGSLPSARVREYACSGLYLPITSVLSCPITIYHIWIPSSATVICFPWSGYEKIDCGRRGANRLENLGFSFSRMYLSLRGKKID